MSDSTSSRKTFKYRLYYSKRDKHLHQQINVAGMIWNHALALQRRHYRFTGRHIPLNILKAHIAKLRREVMRFAYWNQLGAQAVQDVLERLDSAYQKFFQWAKTRKGRKVSPPKFKKVKKFRSFTLKQTGWKLLDDHQIQLQKRVYKFIKHRPLEGEIKTVTVKRDTCGRLWICFSVVLETQLTDEVSTGKIGGFDFGLKTFLTNDEGRTYLNPQYFKQGQKQIAKLNRSYSHKQSDSVNERKARWYLARAHIHVADKRRDYHFQLANDLCEEYDVLIFEDLNIAGMKRRWGRKVSDLGFAQFITLLQHVARRRGKRVVFTDRWERTTGFCSCCGHVQHMELRDRVFVCGNCGVMLDRDHNAARNIVRIGASMLGLEVIRLASVSNLA